MTRPAGYDTHLGGVVWLIIVVAFASSAIIAVFNADNLGEFAAMTLFFGIGFCILPPVWLVAYGLEHARRAIRR